MGGHADHALRRAKYVSCEVLLRINGEVRNYGFGLPGRFVPPHVDLDKLRNE